MTFKEYEKQARKTAIYTPEAAIIYPALGLAGETGEVVEKIKKWVRDGTLDKESVAKEMGDVLWYLAALAGDLNLSLDEIADKNLQKLADRASRGVLRGSGDSR